VKEKDKHYPVALFDPLSLCPIVLKKLLLLESAPETILRFGSTHLKLYKD